MFSCDFFFKECSFLRKICCKHNVVAYFSQSFYNLSHNLINLDNKMPIKRKLSQSLINTVTTKRRCNPLDIGINYFCHDADIQLKMLKKSLRRIVRAPMPTPVISAPIQASMSVISAPMSVISAPIQEPNPDSVIKMEVPVNYATKWDDVIIWPSDDESDEPCEPPISIPLKYDQIIHEDILIDPIVPIKVQLKNIRRVDRDLIASKMELRHIKHDIGIIKVESDNLKNKIRLYNISITSKKEELRLLKHDIKKRTLKNT